MLCSHYLIPNGSSLKLLPSQWAHLKSSSHLILAFSIQLRSKCDVQVILFLFSSFSLKPHFLREMTFTSQTVFITVQGIFFTTVQLPIHSSNYYISHHHTLSPDHQSPSKTVFLYILLLFGETSISI